MSCTFCRVCGGGINTRECCGQATDYDEGFPGKILGIDSPMAEEPDVVAVADDPHELARLADDIEGLGWAVFRLEKTGNAAVAAERRAELAAAEKKYAAINVSNLQSRFPHLFGKV